jgi:hypothetical protein
MEHMVASIVASPVLALKHGQRVFQKRQSRIFSLAPLDQGPWVRAPCEMQGQIHLINAKHVDRKVRAVQGIAGSSRFCD